MKFFPYSFAVIFTLSFFNQAFAQDGEAVTAKIIPVEGETVTVHRVSTSSSSSCMTSDFPVYMGTEKLDVDFSELTELYVRHDIPASDPNNYMSVELIFDDGREGIYEMVKHIRFTGKADNGSYSIKVSDVNMIQVVKGY